VSVWKYLLMFLQLGVLSYFAVLNLLYALFGYLGLRAVRIYARELSSSALKDILERDLEMPVSILVPAYNEALSIVASVSSFLSLHYPEYEVIVCSDGSSDETIPLLIDRFALVEDPRIFRRAVPTAKVIRIYRSLRHPNLTVVEKERGGRADALNASLNLARYPLIAAVDADSLLDAQAVLRAARLFLEDEAVIGVGGTIRPMNGALMDDGRVVGVRMPKHWIERFQVLEYARAFFTGRAGWSMMGGLLIVSGAFGLFRRDAVIDAGGYSTENICEDMELVVRLHKLYRRAGLPYKILFSPDPICWTEVPSSMSNLRRQRNRWHRGLWETLWEHRTMLLNPRYGAVGMIAVPYFWLFEGLAPLVEASGFVILPISLVMGFLFWQFALLFLLLSIMMGMLLSQVAVGIETLLLARYPRVRDRLILFAAAFLECVGYRQILLYERVISMVQIRRKRGSWGAMTRAGIAGPAVRAPTGDLSPADVSAEPL
jgi:cellulose synthase/poly-beta-1,6-N-acetylglucosamine synthase-like glycosyltransferase